jgi:histidyl-tRNA synthetase
MFAVPRGTSDILPDAAPLWEELESKARKICKSYGYREIRTPVYEDINLFKRSLGSTSDVVNKQLLELASGEQEIGGLALRPEGTASVVRSYLEHNFDKKELLSKFFYIGPMFRGERPQKGRLRQFHQIGVEAIGIDGESPFLDAEILALAMHLLQEFNVQNPKLKINSLGSKDDKEQISSWLRAEFAKHRKELCEDCQNRFERNVFRVLDCKNETCRKVVNIVIGKDKILPLSENSRNYFENVQKALKDTGIDYEISPHLVRGLDYYTHTVFEITAEGLGSQDAVGAGGRYGGLVLELGGTDNVGGIGFALGMERILLASGKATATPSESDVFVIAMKEEYQPQAFLLLQQLRQAAIRADMSFVSGSMKSQMGKANKANARFTLILGEEEIKNNTVAVKDMQKSIQETVEAMSIVEIIKNKLK